MGPRILVTGALGQIGTELVEALGEKHGQGSVIATDVRSAPGCRILDVMDSAGIQSLVKDEGITEIYHLAALLSATGERNPDLCWKINGRFTVSGYVIPVIPLVITNVLLVMAPGH